MQVPEWWQQDGDLIQEGTLPAGDYSTGSFTPALSFSLDEGWHAPYEEQIDHFELRLEESVLGIHFQSSQVIFDPDEPTSLDNTDPAPRDMVDWLQNHTYLRAEKPTPVTIGGKYGQEFDVEVEALPEDYPKDLCTAPCLPLFRQADGTAHRLFRGGYHFIVLEVEEDPVIISYDVEEGVPSRAAEILSSVEWGRGN